MNRRTRLVLVGSLAAALALTGCLKTRAQLRSDDGEQPVAQEVRDVRPQEQYVVDEMKQEITRLTGRIEEIERRPVSTPDSKIELEREEAIKRLETRVMELEQAQATMLEAIKKIQTSAPPASTGDLMDRARDEMKSKSYDAAIETLSLVLKNPKSRDAEEATFLRGEAYYESKQYKKAIIDFSKFPEKYGKSRRMPAALFHIGQSFEALGMKEDAKGFYTEVAEKYPASSEGKRAKAKTRAK